LKFFIWNAKFRRVFWDFIIYNPSKLKKISIKRGISAPKSPSGYSPEPGGVRWGLNPLEQIFTWKIFFSKIFFSFKMFPNIIFCYLIIQVLLELTTSIKT